MKAPLKPSTGKWPKVIPESCAANGITTRVLFLFLLGLIIGFYFWIILTCGGRPTWISADYYPGLARAFLKGQLYLEVQPKPELLALSNPYDPEQNEPWRLHDASLYRSKYYLYFGPTPAAILFAPFRILTGRDFFQALSVALFCSIGFVCSAYLLRGMIREHCPTLPLTYLLLGVLSLGLANTTPFLLRRPDVYETAISCAYALLQMALLFFYRATRVSRCSGYWLTLASLCAGAAVGARLNYVLAIPVFWAVAALYLWKNSTPDRPWVRVFLIHVATPVVVIGLLMAGYNMARFGNPFDFGQQYQLAAVNMNLLRFTEIGNVPCNLFYYFFAAPKLIGTFPFLLAEVGRMVWLPDRLFVVDKVAGLFVISPVTLFALGLPILWKKEPSLRLILLYTAGAALATVLPVLAICGTTMRYSVDFAPGLVFVGVLVICHLASLPRDNPVRRFFPGWLLVSILLVGCVSGFFLSFTGCNDFMRRYDAETYAAVARCFAPLESLMKLLLPSL